ncbi:MAG: right-handed parallel beta-helix repeat-containing protein [Opitutaceae bacterium]|jgi:hypothetical protein
MNPSIHSKFNTLLSLLFCIAFAILIPANALSADYYVATNGSDTNDGSSANPWLTINKAALTVTAGATVYVRSGTYNERIRPANSGTAGAPITYQPDTGATVVIDGYGISTTYAQTGQIDILSKSYINIFGFSFVNCQATGIHLSSTNNIKIGNNTFNSDFGWCPILVYGGGDSDIEIYGNYIHRTFLAVTPNPYPWSSNGQPWAEAISVTRGTNISVHDNTIAYNQRGEGIDFKTGTNNSQIYNNTVMGCSSVAIYIDARGFVTDIDIYQNRVGPSPHVGIALSTEAFTDGGATIDRVNIFNNVISSCGQRAMSIGGWGPSLNGNPGYVKNINVLNNTFYRNGTGTGSAIDINMANAWDSTHPNVTVSNVVFRNNLISRDKVTVGSYGGGPGAPVVTVADRNGFDSTTTYTIYGSNAVVGNPQFVDAASGDFRLLAGSVFINAGYVTPVNIGVP